MGKHPPPVHHKSLCTHSHIGAIKSSQSIQACFFGGGRKPDNPETTYDVGQNLTPTVTWAQPGTVKLEQRCQKVCGRILQISVADRIQA